MGAANIANMGAFNTAAIVKTNGGAVPSKAVKGDKPNAISFPTWSVAIGDKPLAADFNYYVVPNGFCYVNQCLESYLTGHQRQGRRLRHTRGEPQHGEARLRD